jgi:hypothetical protein
MNALVPYGGDSRLAYYNPASEIAVLYSPRENRFRVHQARLCPLCQQPLPGFDSQSDEHTGRTRAAGRPPRSVRSLRCSESSLGI